jgi:hypothetical protein
MKPKTSFILIRIDNQEEEENEEGRTRKQLRAPRARERGFLNYFVSSFICL